MSAITLIQTLTMGSTESSSLEFTSIPQTFTDLVVKFSLRSRLEFGLQFTDLGMRLNGDTASNYFVRVLRTREGGVGTFLSNPGDNITVYEATASGATANSFGSGEIYIPNYRSSVAKSVSTEGYSSSNSSNQLQGGIVAGLWSGTAPVNAIRIFCRNNRNFVIGSTASLYGIQSGTSGGVTVS